MQLAITSDQRVTLRCRQFASLAAGLALLTGLAVLVGWALGVSVFKSLLPGLATMKPLSALGFLLAGGSLWLLHDEDAPARSRRLGLACAALVTLIGGLTLLEHLSGQDFGIDQLLFGSAVRLEGDLFAGRPASGESLALLLLGVALLATNARAAWFVTLPTLTTLLIGLLAIIGYTYGSQSLYQFEPFTSMALHTALLCSLLALGVLCARPARAPLSVITTSLAGGMVARQLLPTAVALPLLLGWLGLEGELLAWYDTRIGLALFATANVAIFAGLTYMSATLLNRVDATRQASLTALVESGDRLAGIITSALDAIISFDSQQRVILFNTAAERMFGYTSAAIIGAPLDRLLPASHNTMHQDYIQHFGSSGVAIRTLGTLSAMCGVRSSGEEFPIEAAISQLTIGGERVYTVILRDITERKQAQAQTEFQAHLLAHVSDAVIASDPLLRITAWNRTAETMYGWVAPEVLGRHVSDVLRSEFSAVQRAEALDALQEHGAYCSQVIHHTRDGQPLLIEGNTIVFNDERGQIAGFISVNRDITERKHAEDEIRRLNTELEQRVNVRTAELRAALHTTQALYQLSQTLNEAAELRHLLYAVADQVALALPAEHVMVVLVDLEARQVTHSIHGGITRENAPTISFDELMDGLTGWVVRNGKPLLSSKHQLDARESPAVQHRRAETDCGSIIVVPLLHRDQILGTLTATNRTGQRDFTLADVALLASMAQQVAIGVENITLVQSLRDKEARLRALFEVLPVGVSILDGQRRMLDSNTALGKILRVSKEELERGMEISRNYIHPDGTRMLLEEFASVRALREQRAILNIEKGVITAASETIWISVSAAPLPLNQQGVVVVTSDITELKRAEAQIRTALREKEVLLQEIHHRVKNNLQVISSLLRLQSDSLSDPVTRALFLDNQRRVRSMALIHEQLYRAADFSNIKFADYVASLVISLRRSFAQSSAQVQVRLAVEEVELKIVQAMPLGLIINELISNSLKHAFPAQQPGTQGEIWVKLRAMPAGCLTLEIGDTGPGLPADFDIERSSSMGMQLVHSLVTQLRGHLTVQRQPGVCFTMVIPNGGSQHG